MIYKTIQTQAIAQLTHSCIKSLVNVLVTRLKKVARIAWSLQDLAAEFCAVAQPVCIKSRIFPVDCQAVRQTVVNKLAQKLVDVLQHKFDEWILVALIIGHQNDSYFHHSTRLRQPL